MTRLIFLLLVASLAYGAIGDNAPSVPAGYVAAHPRLGAPGNTYLTNVWNSRADASNATGSKRMFDAADVFDPLSPETTSGGQTRALQACRYLLIAYKAGKQAGSPSSSYLDKIKQLANPGGIWNLTTGGNRTYGSLCMALAYDWTYDDLDPPTRTAFLASFHAMLSAYEVAYDEIAPTPFNDHQYLDTNIANIQSLVVALAAYPDDTVNGIGHLRHAMDVWFNIVMPAWKLVCGGDQAGGASNDSDINGGCGWHEPWQSYFTQVGQFSQSQWWVTVNLAWKNATGDDVFTREGWLKNIAYWPMYLTRPDFLQEKVNGSYTNGYNTAEYDGATFGAHRPGVLDSLARIYDDPTLRWWARLVNWGGGTPWAFEPAGYPWLDPDTSSTVNANRSTLSRVRNFPGWGELFFRTGWGEDDTMVTLQYGDSFWSHPQMWTGSVTINSRGSLLINSGNYKPGSDSMHQYFYASQAIAANTVLVTNPSESFPTELYPISRNTGAGHVTDLALPNDGGHVRNGSGFFISNGVQRNGPPSPGSPGDYLRGREFFHRSKLVGYAVGTSNKYAAAMIDMTAAYNNSWSHVPHVAYNKFTSNSSSRSYRVRKAVRYLVFIPRGTAAYVVTYDQVISSDPDYEKKILWHSVNEPTITGNKFEILRTETVTEKSAPSSAWGKTGWRNLITHCPGGTCTSSSQYIYDGKLTGWMTTPTGGTLTPVGGPGNEFTINGTNYNECMFNQCIANQGLGDTTGYIKSVSTEMPYEPGAWRIEETMDAARESDNIVNVMLATNTGDTNVVSTAPTTSTVGTNLVTIWKDNADACTYTLTLPVDGIGGHLLISGTCVGSQTVDADLLATQAGTEIPAGQWTQINAGGEKIGYISGNVDGGGAVPSLNSFAYLGQYRSGSSEPNQNWFLYSLDENRISLVSAISRFQSPYWSGPGHPSGSIGIDPTNSVAYAFMEHSGGQVNGEAASKTTVSFDFLGGVGRHHRSTTQPSYSTTQQGCTFDTYNRKLVCWGGDSSVNALQIYDPSTNAWSINPTLTGTCPLAGTLMPSLAFNTHDGLVYLFGGRRDPTGVNNNFFTINIATMSCTQITPSGSVPDARATAAFAYDHKRNQFLLHGGTVAATSNTCGTSAPAAPCLLDTWIYDVATNTWTDITATAGTPTPSATTMGGVEYRIAYDPEFDVFVALAQGQNNSYLVPIFFHLFRPVPGPKIGSRTISRSATAGGYNFNAGAWAQLGPTVAASASAVYLGFSQYGAPNATNNSAMPHPYVREIKTGTPVNVPSSATFSSLTGDPTGTALETFDMSVAVVGGTPWTCWNELAGSSISQRMNCKGYSGGSWSLGGTVDLIKPDAFHLIGPGHLIDVGGKPTMIYRDNHRILVTPNGQPVKVVQYDSGTWNFLGDDLRVASTAGSTTVVGQSASIATNGTDIWAAHSEYTGNSVSSPLRLVYTPAKAYLRKWNGTSWDLQCGGPANISTASGWAERVSVAVLAGVPYVAITERPSVSGTSRVYVRKCDAGTWSTVGSGYRNRDQTNGWAFSVKLVSHDGVLDLIWDEQGSQIPWNTNAGYEFKLAESVKIYADRWNGTAWSKLGGALNADTAYGTATAPAIAVSGTTSVAAWGEFKLGSNRTAYAKKWDGTDWVQMSAAEGGSPSSPSSIMRNGAIRNGVLR